YTNNLLASVSDPQGRVHSLGYSLYYDENSVQRRKLTSVTVYGAGSPYRTVSTWSFLYDIWEGWNPYGPPEHLPYGGTYSGDRVVQCARPDALVVNLRYAFNVGVYAGNRMREEDWDGGVTRSSWTDSTEGSAVEKIVTREGLSETDSKVTFPGDIAVQYSYS